MRSTNRMITSHVGSLPRPQDLIELNRRRIDAEDIDETAYQARLREATADVVARQKAIGIDLPNDGEYGHAMGGAIDYSSWWSYTFERLGGLGEWANIASLPMAPAENGPSLTTMMGRRDQARFPAIYGGLAESGGIGMKSSRADVEHGMGIPVCTDAVSYVGQSQVARDIADLQAGLEANGFDEGFMCAIGPASLARIGNAFYETHDAFVWALAEAMREEYKAITDAGLIVQIDEPAFAENWDQFNPEPSIDEYRAFTMVGIEALNHALRGIPREQVRFHCCWGSWHGPHTTDLELRHVIDLLLEIEAGSFSFEAANARHEHEWKVWEDVALPADTVLVPGVVSHATHVVEHPELVADRIQRFAGIVGRENVIASTDCGMGGRMHPDLAWAKLEALAQGAQIATERLW
jgi:5-methyltetrahydropteroyltriglutamate--homocysteine methyltransferase